VRVAFTNTETGEPCEFQYGRASARLRSSSNPMRTWRGHSPQPLGTAAQDCPLLGRSFAVG
jgi:hypothetical protein